MTANHPPSRLLTLLRAHAPSVGAVAAVMLFAGLFMGWQAYSHVDHHRQTWEVSRWSEDAWYQYTVPVVHNSTIWPNGTVLPMGEPGYWRTVSPYFNVEFVWRVSEPADATGVAHADMRVVVRAQAGDGRTFWELSEPLDSGMIGAPGAGLRLQGRVNLDNLTQRVAQTTASLPPQGGAVKWQVETVVKYAGDANAERVGNTSTYVLPIALNDPLITLPGPDDLRWQTPHVRTASAVVSQQAGWPAAVASLKVIALAALGAVALAAAALAAWTDPARGLSAQEVEFQREQARYAEWITVPRRRVPDPPEGHPVVDLASLDDLVNVAIDARARVLLDPARRVYLVFTPQVAYRYEPGADVAAGSRPPPTGDDGLPMLEVDAGTWEARRRRPPAS